MNDKIELNYFYCCLTCDAIKIGIVSLLQSLSIYIILMFY